MMRSSFVLAICLAAPLARADQPADPDTYRAQCRPTSPTAKITLGFSPESTIAQYAAWLSATTCKSVVFEADVGKHRLKATIVAPNRYTVKQATELVLDAIEVTGLVVTQKPDSYVLKRGPNMPACATAALESGETDPDLQAEIDAGIFELDEQTYAIDRTLAKKLLGLPPGVGRQARIVPAMKNGKPDGVKLYAIRPMSAVAQLGFANGDTLTKINGTTITTLESLDAVRVKLAADPKLGAIQIAVLRRGTPVTWSIHVK
jgi:hypothetical protein